MIFNALRRYPTEHLGATSSGLQWKAIACGRSRCAAKGCISNTRTAQREQKRFAFDSTTSRVRAKANQGLAKFFKTLTQGEIL